MSGVVGHRGLLLAASDTSDPYWSSVGFLLHFDGANGSTTLVESGPNPHSWQNAPGAAITTALSVFGGASAAVSGSTGCWDIVTPGDILAAGSSVPWTLEFRFRSASFASAQSIFDTNLLGTNNNGCQCYIGTDGKTHMWSGSQATDFGGFGPAMSINTWYAVRVVYDSISFKLFFFLDGVLLNTGGTTGFNNGWGSLLTLLNSAPRNQPLLGNVDEMRFTKVARSFSDYTVDTTPFGP